MVFLFDPRAGSGAFLRRMLLSEMCLSTADMLAADMPMADAFWQMGVSIAHA
jgi:hypothetical protein